MTPHSRPLQRIRWYITDHGWVGGIFIIPVAVLGTIMALGDRHHAGVAARGRVVEQWPAIEASILSSRIAEVNASSEVHFGTRLSVVAKFGYEVEGTHTQADYVATWDREDSKDWSQVLAPGGSIPLRVSPADRTQVSLWDHNRVP